MLFCLQVAGGDRRRRQGGTPTAAAVPEEASSKTPLGRTAYFSALRRSMQTSFSCAKQRTGTSSQGLSVGLVGRSPGGSVARDDWLD